MTLSQALVGKGKGEMEYLFFHRVPLSTSSELGSLLPETTSCMYIAHWWYHAAVIVGQRSICTLMVVYHEH